MDYQLYTMDRTGTLLHAGVHKLGRFSFKTIRKLERDWQIWRKQYIAEHPSNYPLAVEAKLQPMYVTVFPVANPNHQRNFRL